MIQLRPIANLDEKSCSACTEYDAVMLVQTVKGKQITETRYCTSCGEELMRSIKDFLEWE